MGPFKGEKSWLSNMYAAPFKDREGLYWRSSEHYYQAGKFERQSKAWNEVRAAANGYEAKRIARKYTPTTSREDMVKVMKWALWFKFTQNAELRKKLLATGETEIVEHNSWGDVYWGVCGGKGQNMLGKLLMQLRDKLRQMGA